MFPNFLIIGAQKAATTYIQTCLKEHPQIFIPIEEIPYFEDPDFHQMDQKEFEQLFSDGIGKSAVGLKRPDHHGSSIPPVWSWPP